MADAMPPTSDLSQQFSTGSIEKKGGISACRNLSFDIKLLFSSRFTVGRQSSLDLNCRSNCCLDELTVLENLNCTMQLLFLACHGDVHGVEELLQEGDDVNNIDLDGRTVLHIAACKEHLEVVRLLIRWRASIDARYRRGSMLYLVFLCERSIPMASGLMRCQRLLFLSALLDYLCCNAEDQCDNLRW